MKKRRYNNGQNEKLAALLLALCMVFSLADYGCTAKVLGLGGVGDINFIRECGEAAEGTLYSAPWVPSFGGADPEAARKKAELAKGGDEA